MTNEALPIHLVLPMSGQGTRFQKAGYDKPKPLIHAGGRPMVSRLMDAFPRPWPASAVLASNHLATELPELLKSLRPDITIFSIPEHKSGPGLAVKKALESIPPEAPVLVSYCDYGMSWDPVSFEEFVWNTQCDACVISYRGFHPHYLRPTPYAYSRMDGERVVEVKEKGWFGPDRELEYASCGAYYFRSAAILAKALEAQDQLGLTLNGESYTSLTVEALLRSDPKAHVRVFEISRFYQWGTPEDLEIYEYWHKTMGAASRYLGIQDPAYQADQILIPMCGRGSRFTPISSVPKPFIPIDGRPMFIEALQSLPKGATHIVALEEHKGLVDNSFSKTALQPTLMKFLAETPPGQALSVAAGAEGLNDHGDIVISACDHGIVLDPKAWANFRADPGADAAIFTIQGFPGGARKPSAFAWVETDKVDGTPFPKVKKVSVKKALSDEPLNDHLLVGTFWFRNRSYLQSGLKKLIEKDTRVNGEVYLDSVFQELIADGHIVRIIPLKGYICWGDPEALAESLYWQEVLLGRNYSIRSKLPGVK